jgi:hypothetical protein
MLAVLFVLISVTTHAQTILGKWYMVTRNGLTEFHITDDSLVSRQLYPDMRPMSARKEKDILAFRKIATLNDRALIIYRNKLDTTIYTAMTMFDIKKDQVMKLAWNSLDTTLTDMDTLVMAHKASKKKLFGYTIYNEKQLPKIKQMKSINAMTMADFKKYANLYANKVLATWPTFEKKYNIGSAYMIYNYQLITQSIFETGFNPLVTSTELETVYKKYFNDPEVRKILEKTKPKR